MKQQLTKALAHQQKAADYIKNVCGCHCPINGELTKKGTCT